MKRGTPYEATSPKPKTFLLWSDRIEVPAGVKIIRVLSKDNRRCTIIGNDLYSYDTKVATIDWVTKTLFIPSRSFKYSLTTNRHMHEVLHKFQLTEFSNRPDKVKKCEMTHGFSR